MSTTPNFSLPLLTATQAGKEITVNQALTMIDAILAASGTPGSTSTITAAELSALFLNQAQLTALLDTELAKLPVPVTSAQLTTALAGLPAGVTLAQLQAELANLPASQGGGLTLAQLQTELNARPVPATVADVQAAVAGLPTGSGGSGITLAQLQAEIAKLAPAAFASNYTKLGVLNNTQTGVTAGAFPSVVYAAATGKFYYMDNARGLVEYDLATQSLTASAPPLSPPGYKTIAPSLSVLQSGKLLWAGATQNSSTASKACYTFDPAASSNKWSASFNSNVAQSGAASFTAKAGALTVLVGGAVGSLFAQIYDESTGSFTLCDSYMFPSSFTVDGQSYSGASGVKACNLPSGIGLAVIPTSSVANSAATALKLVVNANGTPATNADWGVVTATPTAQRFPANSSCLALAGTSYGAVALVRAGGTGLTRFYKYVEATDSWTPMAEGLGLQSAGTNAVAMAANPADQVLVVTESGTNPGLYLLNAA